MTFFHILKKFSRIVSLFDINFLFLKYVDKYSCPSHVEWKTPTYILIFFFKSLYTTTKQIRTTAIIEKKKTTICYDEA